MRQKLVRLFYYIQCVLSRMAEHKSLSQIFAGSTVSSRWRDAGLATGGLLEDTEETRCSGGAPS